MQEAIKKEAVTSGLSDESITTLPKRKTSGKPESIAGGATLWARQTLESEIFYGKPAEWFKIWFYLVNRAGYRDSKRFKRGEVFLKLEWICDATGASIDQVKKCMTYLRKSQMLSTARSTRGTHVFLPQYSHYQTLDNYYFRVKAPDEALEKHQRSTTILKNNKKDKNISAIETIAETLPFDSTLWVESLIDPEKTKRRDLRMIGNYYREKRVAFPTQKAALLDLKRWLRDAGKIAEYPAERVQAAFELVRTKFPEDWNLATVAKYIPETA